MAEEVVKGGDGLDEEEIKEVILVDLRTCRPKTNGRSFVWAQRLFLLDPRKRVVCNVCNCCALLTPCFKGNTSNLIAHYESPRLDNSAVVVTRRFLFKASCTMPLPGYT